MMGFENILAWYLDHVNYWTVFILMTIESSFIPFPSEIVIPPAAYLAAQGELNIFLVILSGTGGAIAGALFNYYFALLLGRKVLYQLAETRWARMLLIREKSLIKAEIYFNKYGNLSTLIGRLVPAIRQLISLPAGFSRMPMMNFIGFTFIGSAIWNIILAALGFFFYSQKEVFSKFYREISLICLFVGIIFVVYIVIKNFKKSDT